MPARAHRRAFREAHATLRAARRTGSALLIAQAQELFEKRVRAAGYAFDPHKKKWTRGWGR